VSDVYSGGYGGIAGGNERDRIAQALMGVANPPPGGLPPGGMGQQAAPGQMTGQRPAAPMGAMPQQAPIGGMAGVGGMGGMPAMPQAQPAAYGRPGPPMGPTGPIGGPYDPNLGLPGLQQPGQLPQGIKPGTGY
jgi:hypothetical protein